MHVSDAAITEGPAATGAAISHAPRAPEPRLLPLALLAGLGAASMNLVLSSLPDLQAVLGVDYHAAQGLITAFLAGAALGQLATGPLADARDRRVLLIAALVIFTAGSAAAGLAVGLPFLAAGRFLQGLGGAAALVLAEAIVARVSRGPALARRIGLLNAGMALAIMLAPLAGAVLAAGIGWHALFFAPAAAGLALLVWAWRLPPMPAPSGTARGRAILGMARLLASRRFLVATLAGGFVMANYFCLAAFGPYIAISLHGLDRLAYSLLFAALGIGYIAGNIASGRLYARYGERRVVIIALESAVVVGSAGFALALAGRFDAGLFLAVGLVVAAATGLTLPSATGRALTAVSGAAGTAAGLFNFAIFGIGALATHVVGGNLDPAALAPLAVLPAVTLVALLAVVSGYAHR
jgi:DHA1 family bicyclomycin/chloramphenicol resistance-like MFS transporter